MHLSARTGHVQLLLDHGADANLVNDDGRSPYQLSWERSSSDRGCSPGA